MESARVATGAAQPHNRPAPEVGTPGKRISKGKAATFPLDLASRLALEVSPNIVKGSIAKPKGSN